MRELKQVNQAYGRNAETISDNSDVKSLTRGVLREIKVDASKNAQNAQDAVTKYHLEDLVYQDR